MGIHDRDYMKRSPDDDGRRAPDAAAEEKVGQLLAGVLTRHRRLPMVVVIVLVALAILGLAIGRL